MELQSYCDNIATELMGWKVKVYDIVRKLDKMPTGDKEKVVPQVNELHTLIEELTDRIDRLKKECPAQWEPDKMELEGKISTLNHTWEQVMEKV